MIRRWAASRARRNGASHAAGDAEGPPVGAEYPPHHRAVSRGTRDEERRTTGPGYPTDCEAVGGPRLGAALAGEG